MDSNNNAKCKDLSNDQKALLARTLTRMKAMHTEPSAFVLALTLRANDMPTENLEQVRAWLAEHQADPVPPDRWATPVSTKPESGNVYDIPKGISENVIDISAPGVHDRKGCEKDMAGNATTAPAQDMSWILRMDEEGKKSGNSLKMEPNDDKTVQFLSNPVEGINEYQGQKRIEFKAEVEDLKTGEQLVWAIRQKEVMQQIVGIMRVNKLSSLVGVSIDVSTRGPDAKTKHWFLRMAGGNPGLQQPVAKDPAHQQPAPQDQGQAWLQQQRQGVQ